MALTISVTDVNFKNEDNPYGSFVMHYYNSELDEFGKHVELNDNLYPLSLCKDAVASPWTTKTYCVDYDYEKIKIGKNYNTNQ